MKSEYFTISFLAGLTLLGSVSQAAFIYVGGGFPTACGTPLRPCTSIGDAFIESNITNGDTIVILGMLSRTFSVDVDNPGLVNITVTGQTPDSGFDFNNLDENFRLNGVHGWTLTNLTLTRGLKTGNGGCLAITASQVDLIGLTLSDCHSSGEGGAISWNGDATLPFHMRDVEILDSSAASGGGLSVVSSGELFFEATDIRVSRCSGSTRAGGIYIQASSTSNNARLNGVTVSQCSAQDTGGIQFNFGGSSLLNSTIDSCTSDTSGGGIKTGTLYMEDTVVKDCTAVTEGGGVYVWNLGGLTANKTTLQGNTAFGQGGAVYHLNSASFHDCRIVNNYSHGHAGGIYAKGPNGNLVLKDNTLVAFNLGRDGYGGGVFLDDSSFPQPTQDFIIRENTALGNSNHDNFYCNGGGACSGWSCGTCRFGKCDFDEGVAEDPSRCLCFPGVSNSLTGNKRCDQCIAPGMGWSDETMSCEYCDEGHYAVSGSRDIAVCEPCPMGTYRDAPGGSDLSACTRCPPNTYFNATTAGATSANACVPCPSGFFSKEGAQTCDTGTSGDFTQLGTQVDTLEATVASGYSDVQNDVASLDAKIEALVAKMDQLTAIDGGIRLGTKVYCDEGYRPTSDGDACEEIPPAPPAPQTLLAVSLVGNALTAVGVAFILFSGYSPSRRTDTGALPRSR